VTTAGQGQRQTVEAGEFFSQRLTVIDAYGQLNVS
jgi:hypothetical protein